MQTVSASLLKPPNFWVHGKVHLRSEPIFWKLLGRPIRKSDLSSEHEEEWAVLCIPARVCDAEEPLQPFFRGNFKLLDIPPCSPQYVFQARDVFQNTELATYRPNSFAYEGVTLAAVVLVPCSESEISVIVALKLQSSKLQWKIKFPRWATTQYFTCVPSTDVPQHAIDASLKFNTNDVYKPAGQPLSTHMNEYIILNVEVKTGQESLIPFQPADWCSIVPGVLEVEPVIEAKYVPSLNAFFFKAKQTWWVVLQKDLEHKHQAESSKPQYVPWLIFNEPKFSLMVLRTQMTNQPVNAKTNVDLPSPALPLLEPMVSTMTAASLSPNDVITNALQNSYLHTKKLARKHPS